MQGVAAMFQSKLLLACADSDPSYDHSARSYRLGGASMRVLRSVVAAFIALNFFGWVAEAVAASDCPCKKIAPNLCIPDPDCAHRYGWRSKSSARPTPGNSGNNPGFNPGN